MEDRKKPRGFLRINKIRSYILIKNIKSLLKKQERKRRTDR
jgi:hypothetical protein